MCVCQQTASVVGAVVRSYCLLLDAKVRSNGLRSSARLVYVLTQLWQRLSAPQLTLTSTIHVNVSFVAAICADYQLKA